MSSVIGLHGQDVPNLSLAERATDAREALRKLLAAVEAGELDIDQWLFIYDVQSRTTPARVAGRSLDSGITTAEAVYMARTFEFDIMLRVRDMT